MRNDFFKRAAFGFTGFLVFLLAFFVIGKFSPANASYPGYFSTEAVFCESNYNTNWQVAYRFNYADLSHSSYRYIITAPVANNAPCSGSDVADEILSNQYFAAAPSITWWTQCWDPNIDPYINNSVQNILAWRDDVTYSGGTGGNNLGTVYATDSTGSSCPADAVSPPGAFSVSGFFECSGSNSGVRITGGPSSGATGYKIYWRVTGNSGDSPRSGTYYQVLTGSLPYSNYTFTPGTSFTFDVAATNAGGDTWSSNGWFFGTAPTGCGGGGGSTADIKANGSDGPITIASGSSATISWTSTGASSCTVYKAGSAWNSGVSNGGVSSGALSSSTVFSITCNTGATDSVTVNVSGGGGTWSLSSSEACSGTSVNITFNYSVPAGFTGYLRSNYISIFIPAMTVSGSGSVTQFNYPSNSAYDAQLTGGATATTLQASLSKTSMNCGGGGGSGSCSWSPAGPIAAGSQSTVTYSYPTGGGSAGLTSFAGATFITSTPTTLTYRFDTAGSTWTFQVRNMSLVVVASCNISTNAPVVTYSLGAQKLVNGVSTAASGSITTASNPNQAGQISCLTNCSLAFQSYNSGTTVTLTATPAAGYTLTGWSVSDGTSCPGVGTCTVTMNAGKTVSALLASPPAVPANLVATSSCPGGVLTVNFSWTDNATNETGYYVDVTTTAAGWGSWSYRSLGANSTSATWSASSPLTQNGSAFNSPAISTNYYWRVNAWNGAGSAYTYYGGGAGQPGSVFSSGNPCVPTPPTNLTASVSCTAGLLTVNFSWTDNATNETSYYVDVTTTANGWGGSSYKLLGANATSFAWSSANQLTWNGGASIPSPTANTSYYWRVNAYNGSNSYTYYGGGALPNGNVFSSGADPCAPTSLSVSLPPCANGAGYQPTFSWTGTPGANWWLNVDSNSNWDNNLDGIAEADASNHLVSASPYLWPTPATFQPGITYRWNIYYGSGSGLTARFIVAASNDVSNAQLIAGSGFVPGAGYTFSVPPCADLDMNDAASQLEFYTDATYTAVKTPPAYNAGATMYIQAKVKNVGPADINSPFRVAFYLQNGAPTCGLAPGGANPGTEKTINSLASGATDTWQFTTTAPNIQSALITASVFADYTCVIAEGPGAAAEANNIKTKNYSVDVKAWFETKNGDVGAASGITSSTVNPASKYQSDYLVIGNILDANVASAKWKISGYTGPLMPAGTYSYLADRFKVKAQSTNQCNFSSLVTGLAYCAGNVTLGTSMLGAGKNVAWFIDGDLIITGDVTVDPTSAIAFIVSGDVKVQTPVSRLDGIYTAGKSFTDVTDAGTLQGKQLVVKGSVYTEGASGIKLDRKLASSNCSATGEPVIVCDNALNPAESFRFDPKYLVSLGAIIATPSVSWQEVAP